MPALAHHVTLRLRDDRVITPGRAARRRLVRAILSLGPAVLAFHVADTHVHLLLLAARTEAGELARRLEIAASRGLGLGVPFEPARVREVRDQAHLRNAFDYILRQAEHHVLLTDPHRDGSSVLDALGLRALDPGVGWRVREHLPRLGRDDLLRHVGVPALEERASPEHLAEATKAAFALEDLAANTAVAVAARAAAVQADRASAADALGLTDRAVRRLLARGADRHAVRAVRLQMDLRAQVAEPIAAFVAEAEAAAYA